MLGARFIYGVLFYALVTASALSWLRWGLRPRQFGGPESSSPENTRAESSSEVDVLDTQQDESIERTPWPQLAIFAMLFWVTFMVLEQTASEAMALIKKVEPPAAVDKGTEDGDDAADASVPRTFDTKPLMISMVMGCAVFVGLGLLLFASGRLRPEDVGIDAHDWYTQMVWGQQAFIAAIVPTAVVIFATLWFRRPETQHPFLQMVAKAPDQIPFLLMFFLVAVVAPLSEELVFRVTLQGWLTERWHARGAIIATALIFAFVHGWRDGIALIPLALILGYLYHARRSYLAVVTAHGMFNAANMALALLSAMGSSSTSG